MKKISRPLRLFAALGGFLLTQPHLMAQQNIGFIEDFALAENREEALKQLIPGTPDYYYYHALHFQNERQVEKYDQILIEWEKNIQQSEARKQIQNREALIRYSDDPEATLAYLRKELNLPLDHQQEGKARDASYPSTLDQSLISWQAFLDNANSNSSNLENLHESAFYRFLESKPELSSTQRRSLLNRATLPDLPGLTDLILTDLKSRESKGFGEFAIHRSLTKAQLEKLLEGQEDLIANETFVETYLAKLLPGPDENLASSPEVREAYLDRAWKFVSTLAPAFNSLKAHLLYQRLVHDRALGKENELRFLAYLALPRNVSYLNPEWRKTGADAWRFPADLTRDYRPVTTLPPVQGTDENLVKDYLLHFLKDASDTKKYAPFLQESWLRRVFAEAKITHGIGEPADWAALLTPSEFQALKDRVDIEFDPTNRETHAVNDPAELKVHLKNVPKLIVKVFEINTLNYYQNRNNEISTDIDLDGLVANHAEVHEYPDAPQLRIERSFKIPAIENRRGLWVVEFIGGGKSSRAVIRKGELGILTQTLPQGETITVLDEAHQPIKEAGVWLGGQKYRCDDRGRALVPFSNSPGTRSVVVEDATGFATLARFVHSSENYELAAGIHLNQESLRSGGTAKIVIRPTLTVAGETISLSKIESASLELSSMNLDGLPATKTIPDFKLTSDRESVHEFRVPDRLSRITATLRVKLKVASQGGKEIELTASQNFSANDFLKTDTVGDLYLSKIDGHHIVEYLGRNGEPQAAQNLVLSFIRSGFSNYRRFTLKTNEVGAIDLGELSGISMVDIQGADGTSRSWNLQGDRRNQTELITLAAGKELKIPFIGDLKREEVAFFSYSTGGIVSDEFSRLKISDGYLIATDLPAGDYRLTLKRDQQVVRILVAKGTVSEGYVFNDSRMLELPARQPSHLAKIEAGEETLEIDVSGADPLTRIHVIATRFLPGNDPFLAFGRSQRPGLTTGQTRYLPSLYISGRNLGDELRYILERRYAQKFPGNMLDRPEILLNPWAIRDTEAGVENLADGDKFGRKDVPMPAPATEPAQQIDGPADESSGLQSPSFEFLANDPVMVTNLSPDGNGKISIKLEAFGDRQHIHVLLVDPEGSTYRSLSLPDRETERRDLRLLKPLDQKRHFTEQESVTLLKKGDTLKLPDLLNSQFEVFDNLATVQRYFLTLNDDPTLREFSFITKWPDLSDDEKKEKYSQYACHELSFFLSRKDPEFFKKVISPYLANKKDRTFMDDYLLGNSLDKYLPPFEYARLNVVERLLLSSSDPKRLSTLALDLEQRLALQTPDLGRAQYLFGAALSGGGFGDSYAGALVEDAKESLSAATADDGISDSSSRMKIVGRAGKPASATRTLSHQKKRQSVAALEEVALKYESKALGVDAFMIAEDQVELEVEQLYRGLEPTKEWAENNYYHLLISQHTYDLIDENHFWLDLAKNGLKGDFGSRHLGEATGNFSEMVLALAFLDLPFSSPEHTDKIEDGALDFTAGGPALLFHREIKEAGMAANRPPLLVSQSFFQQNDRFRMENGEKVDKFITDEFVRGIVYGAQVVVTNPTSTRQRLDILTQLPKGALPIQGQRTTATQQVQLEPYATHRLELAFYFPDSGEFPIYPAHLSKAGEVIAHADPLTFKVVDEPTMIDKTSWAWISQWAEESDVLKFLETENLHAIDLTKVAWRCRESADFYQKALALLSDRGVYQPVLQSYALVHFDREGLVEFLLMQGGFLNSCGWALSCDLITVDPIERRTYEHLEYKPLINSRAHPLGGENRILNPVILSQYCQFLEILSQRKSLDPIDQLGVTYYLFLQDRVEEALAHLSKVDADKLPTQMQFDYFQAYAAFYQSDLEKAREIADKYADGPVTRWRERFAEINSQIAEIKGAQPAVHEDGNREQEHEAAAAREPSLDLNVEGSKALLDFRNIAEVTINYYEMDLEFLFSTNPFVSSGTSRFSVIRPNKSVVLKLPEGKTRETFELPEEYRASNVIIEVLGGGKTASKAVYANDLKTSLSETMGLLSVRHGTSDTPLPKVYVKVYARTNDGVKFFKDGYTDLRGKFDYASVSTTGLGQVERFSILVMSEENGANVLEAAVPRR